MVWIIFTDKGRLRYMISLRSRLRRTVLALCLVLLLLPSQALAHCIIWISDTQHYSESYPETFNVMTQWIVDNKEALDIRFVFHSGDLVNASRSDLQWSNAAASMKKLDGVVPYICAAGNHDVGKKYNYDIYYSYVDDAREHRSASNSYGYGQSRYMLFSSDGRDYVFLSIGFERRGPSEEEILWINRVLSFFDDRIAVIVTHSYLHSNGKDLTTQGKNIYENIVVPNSNVWLILSGHCRRPASRTDELDDDGDGIADRTVYSVMSNYQDAPKGGSGYLRIINFGPTTVCFSTYSPLLDDYTYFEKPRMDNFCILYPDEKRTP